MKVIIYTDGGASPNPGLGGWAAILISPAHNFKKEFYGSETETTNNRMELTAAIQALRALKYPCEVDLHTDSSYLQKAFESGWLKKWRKNGWKTSAGESVLNKDLWLKLWDLSKVHKISWHWVKGHYEDKMNNRCDELVQKARQEYEEQKMNL